MTFLRFVLFLTFVFSIQVIFAQAQASKTGTVSGTKNENQQESEFEDAETLAVDFKNFKYTDNNNQEFQLTDGNYSFTNPKTKTNHKYQFRKVYYFDVTGDKKKDAVVHLLADNCEFCEIRSIFYVFSAKNKALQTIWKFFAGSGAKCGLKDISFKSGEIVFETFGNCNLIDSTLTEDELLKKTDAATRITLYLKDGGFIQKSKENFIFPQNDIYTYRTQIKFGS